VNIIPNHASGSSIIIIIISILAESDGTKELNWKCAKMIDPSQESTGGTVDHSSKPQT
jgi:hypothetical protein